jgi:hypothetical protein
MFREPLPIVLDAKLYRLPRGYVGQNQLQALRARTELDYWATPRASLTAAAQIMTKRTSHDLPTQIRCEINTPNSQRACAVNPGFLEWLMGFPDGWTKAA